MDILQGILNSHTGGSNDSTTEKKEIQSTILLLIDRLDNSTLLADRKASIQSIKSFSRENREFIIEQGVKPILFALERDSESSEMVQLILETLLNLLIRSNRFTSKNDVKIEYVSKERRIQNGKYPSPLILSEEDDNVFDELSIWITDEFLKKSDVFLQLIIDTLASNEKNSSSFHLKFYCILILEALVAIRPEMAIECIIKIPTSLNSLISLLDDVNVQIKNETLLLLISLVNNEKKIGLDNTHLKSLIVFEGIFNKLFAISLNEKEHLIVKKDCLVLVGNLIKYNSMNQRIFLQDNYNLDSIVKILLTFLNENYNWSSSNDDLTILENTILLINYLVEEDTDITSNNQSILFNDTNVGMILLQLSFKPNILVNIRILLLDCIGKIIKANESLQDKFGTIDVPLIDPIKNSIDSAEKVLMPVYKILLNWSLKLTSVHALKLRLVCNELIKCFLFQNKTLQQNFINNQLKEYSELEDNEINIFYNLLEYDSNLVMNPYKLYFVIDLFIFLINDNRENKDLLLLNTDNETNYLEIITELLITHLNSNNNNIRLVLFYLQFLEFIVFQDFKYVNKFLDSKLNLKQILTYLNDKQFQLSELIIVKESIFLLVGIIYDFSTSESPIDRKSLHKLITKTTSIENYKNNIKKLYDNENLKNSLKIDYLDNSTDFIEKNSGLPNLYFIPEIHEFILANKTQFINSLSQDPLLDPKEKITFENFNLLTKDYSDLNTRYLILKESSLSEVNELKSSVDLKTKEIEKLNEKLTSLVGEISTIKSISLDNESKLKEKINIIDTLNNEKKLLSENSIQNQEKIESLEKKLTLNQKELENLTENFNKTTDSKTKFEEGINKMNKELRQMIKEKDALQSFLNSKEEKFNNEIKDCQKQIKELNLKLKESEDNTDKLTKKVSSLEDNINALETDKSALEKNVKDFQNKFKSNESLIPKLQSRLKEAQETNTLKLDELKNLTDSKIKSLEKEIEEKDDLVVTISEELDSINLKINEKDLMFEELESNFLSISEELDNVNSQLSQKDSELSNITSLLVKTKDRVKAADDQCETLKCKLEESEQIVNKKDEEFLKLADNVKTLKSKFESKNNKFEELTLKNKDCLDKIESLKQSHARELSEIKQLHLKELDNISQTLNSEMSHLESENLKLTSTLGSKTDMIKKKDVEINELDEKLGSANKQITELKEIIGGYEIKITNDAKTMNENKIQLETIMKTNQDTVNKLNDEIKQLKSNLQGKEAEIADTKSFFDANTAEITQLTEKLNIVNKKLEKALCELEDKKEAILLLESTKDSLNTEAAKNIKSHETIVKDLNNNLLQFETKYNELNSTISGKDEKISDLENNYSLLKEKLTCLEETISKSKEIAANNDHELEHLKSQIKINENKISELNKELSTIQKDKNLFESSNSEIINQLESESTKIKLSNESLQKENADLKSQYEILDSENQKNILLVQEASILKKKIENMDDNLSELELKIREKDSTIATMESKRVGDSVLKEEILVLKTKISALESEKADKINTLNQLNNTVDELKSQIVKKCEENDEIQKNISSLQSKIEASNIELKELKTFNEIKEKTNVNALDKLKSDILIEESKSKKLGDLLETLKTEIDEKEKQLEEGKVGFMRTENSLNEIIAKLQETEEIDKKLIFSLEKKIETSETDNLQKSTESETLNDKLKSLETDNTNSEMVIKELNLQLKDSKNELETLKSEIDLLTKNNDINKKNENDYILNIENMKKLLDSVSHSTTLLTQENFELKADIENYNLKLNEQNEEFKTQLIEKDSEIKLLNIEIEKIATLINEIDQLKLKIEAQEQVLNSNQFDINLLNSSKEEQNKMTQEILSLKEEIIDHKQNLTNSQVKLLKKNEEIERLSKEIENIVEITTSLETEISIKDKKIAEIQETKYVNEEKDDDDDLLLLIDDLEIKKKMYKDELKKLGKEVSEDED
ncbi:hypothetical protein QEN19_002513 [Hanseniaspora menglaensis]